MSDRQKSAQHAQEMADMLNAQYPVGTEVQHRSSRQPDAIHKTTRPAVVLNGKPCFHIGGRKGYVAVENLHIVSAPQAQKAEA